MPSPLLYAGIGSVALVVGLGAYFRAFPKDFALVRRRFSSGASWAAARGEEIRTAFRVQMDPLQPNGDVRPQSMSIDAWNRRKIATLNPRYRRRFSRFFVAAQSIARRHGRELMIWEGSRSLERQYRLYQRGRTTPGTVVTRTIAASTGHIWGLAIDLVMRGRDGGPDWSMPDWYKTEVLPLAARFKLESLWVERGIDPPHVEAPRSELPPLLATTARALQSDFPGV